MTYRQQIKTFLIKKTARLLINLIIKTCQLKITGAEKLSKLRGQGIPIIYAYWHRHIFVTIYRFKNTGARPLISLSKDGELVAQIAEEFGMKPVRGSSSKGGARAFVEMVNTIKHDHAEVLITADGPKGPLREIKDGTIRLAQKTGAIIIPIAWHATRVKIFEKTWDQFKIPRPFSRITYAYGTPFPIPTDTKPEDYAGLKKELKTAIDHLEKELEQGALPHQ
jgi:lysophospholipid acyltransferase (LPLAT)-like uncharacterized protein